MALCTNVKMIITEVHVVTSEPDERVCAGINVAGFTPIRSVISPSYSIDAESRIHNAAIFVYIPGDRVPTADDRCPGVAVVPADGVRVPGKSTDEVRRVSNAGLDVALQRSGCRRDY